MGRDAVTLTTPLSPAMRLATRIAYYRRNPDVYFSDQLKIRTKEGELIPFVLWPCQQPVLDAMMEQRRRTGWVRYIVLKARQVGMSAMSEAMMSWSVMLNPNNNGLIVAHDAATAETLFGFCKTYYDFLANDIKPLKRFSTRREFVFENPDDNTRPKNPGLGSRLIITSANNIHSGIGRTLRSVHISEAARFTNAEGIIDGIFPALAKTAGTMCIIESTARYSGQWFREACDRAKAKDGDFEFIFVPWFLQPGYAIPLLKGERLTLSLEERQIVKKYGLSMEQIKFFRAELANIGNEALFKQSYPLNEEECWITPGDQVFPWDKIDGLRSIARQMGGPWAIGELTPNLTMIPNPKGRLTIWKEPEKGVVYDIGVDVGLGTSARDDSDDEGDWSVMCVLRRGTNEQVAEWRSKSVDVMELASHAATLGYYYNRAQIAVEVNSIGIATNMQLTKTGYSNLYVWRYRDEISPRMTKKVGWETSYRTKKLLVSFAVHQMNNNNVVIRSETLLDELRNFVHLGNERYGGAAGHHDDTVMAWQIALLSSDDENFEKWMNAASGRTTRAYQDDPTVIMHDRQSWNSDPGIKALNHQDKVEWAAWD